MVDVSKQKEASFSLSTASRADIERFSRIHVDACADDNAIRLYFKQPGDFYNGVTAMLDGQIGDPAWTHMKAIDTASGQIAAWASWLVIEAEANHSADEKGHRWQNTTPTQSSTHHKEGDVTNPASEGRKTDFEFPQGLGAYIQAETIRFFTPWTEGRRHISLRALFTDKRFRRRGMGTSLVHYGNNLADSLQLPVFCQATPFGFPLYAGNQFKVIGSLDVDLRDWAPDGRVNDKGWGNYRFRYMLREPLEL